MNRRRVMFGLGCTAVLTVRARAQQSKRSLRIGVIAYGDGDLGTHLHQSLLEGLRAQGYVEGVNLVIVRRYAHGQFDHVAPFARELAGLQLDAVLGTCTPTTRAMTATPYTGPLVMASVSDPVGQGLIASYARPGGNITGTASQFEDLTAKMFGLLHEMLPKAKTIAVLQNPSNPVHKLFLSDIAAMASSLRVALIHCPIVRPDDVETAFAGMRGEGADAVLVLADDPKLFNLRRRIVAQLTARRLPSFFGWREAVEDGGLASYGESLRQSYFRSAHYLGQIANGVKPADLPVEQPTKFELVINLKTASALGLTVPPAILLRADEVIE